MFDALNWSSSVLTDLSALTRLEGFVKSGGYHWSFSNAEQQDIASKRIVSIQITKIKPFEELEIIDEVTRKESLTEVADVKARDAVIYIDIDSHLAAVETHGHLTKHQISDVLIEGYKQLGLLYEPIFDYTYDDDLIEEHIKRFGAARQAIFSLTTTNPHANDEFKPLDDELRQSGVQKSHFIFTPKQDSKLNITNPQSIVRKSLMMAAAGYGSGRISGTDIEGKPIVLNLGENLVDILEIHESLSDDEVLRNIIVKFKKKDREDD